MSYGGTTATKRSANFYINDVTTNNISKHTTPLVFPIGEITSISRDWKKTRITVEGGIRAFENIGEYHGGLEVSWSTDFMLTNGRFFYLALDGYTPSGTYVHTFKSTGLSLPYFSIDYVDMLSVTGVASPQADLIAGCWTENVSISASADEIVNVSMSGQALDIALSATNIAIIAPDVTANPEGGATVNYNGEPYRFNHCEVILDDGTDKAYIDVMHSFKIDINNSITRGPINGTTVSASGNYIANYFTLQKRELTAEITMDVDTTTYPLLAALIEDDVAFGLVLSMVRGAADQIILHFPSCKVFEFPKDWSESIKVTLNCIIYNADPTDTPTAIGTTDATTAWAIETQDTIPDYSNDSSAV